MPLIPMPPIPMKCACCEVTNILGKKLQGSTRDSCPCSVVRFGQSQVHDLWLAVTAEGK